MLRKGQRREREQTAREHRNPSPCHSDQQRQGGRQRQPAMSVHPPTGGVASIPLLQKEMAMKSLITLAACMLGFAGVCDAAQIASPTIYASPSQNVALCAVYNGGTTAQTVRLRLFDEGGVIPAPAADNCGSALPAGGFCSIAKIGLSSISAFACSATAVS